MMKREKSQRADTVATAESSSADPSFAVRKKRTQNEALLDGLQALLDAKRTKSALTKLGSTRVVLPFLGRGTKKRTKTAGQWKPAPVMLQKFRDDKAKISANEEVRKAIVLEKKNCQKVLKQQFFIDYGELLYHSEPTAAFPQCHSRTSCVLIG